MSRQRQQARAVRLGLSAVVGAALGMALAGAPAGAALGALAAVTASIASERRRRAAAARLRRRLLVAALPDAIELLASTVDGGAPAETAIARVADFVGEPLAGLLRAAGAEARDAGIGPYLRAADPALRPLGSLLQQSDELGVPIATSLRLLAADARLRARVDARERAAAAAPKMLLVVGGLLAPAALLIVIGGQALALRSLIGPVLG